MSDIEKELLGLRAECIRLRSALSTAREEGRQEGLEEAATHMERCATLMSDYATQMAYRTRATAIRKLKEKQP